VRKVLGFFNELSVFLAVPDTEDTNFFMSNEITHNVIPTHQILYIRYVFNADTYIRMICDLTDSQP